MPFGFLALFSYFEAIIRWLSSFCQKEESKDDEPGERRGLRTGSHSFIRFILCVCIFPFFYTSPSQLGNLDKVVALLTSPA